MLSIGYLGTFTVRTGKSKRQKQNSLAMIFLCTCQALPIVHHDSALLPALLALNHLQLAVLVVCKMRLIRDAAEMESRYLCGARGL